MQADIIVVGAGVSGLTCAIALRDQGFPVRLWARDPPADTTSAVAAALWFPYSIAPQARTLPWSMQALRTWQALAAQLDTGVTIRPTLMLGCDEVMAACAHQGLVMRAAHDGETVDGRSGWVAELPVVDMSIYLAYLLARLHAAGCSLEQRTVADLQEPLQQARVVVNCTGLGARHLADDASVYPIRGQVVRIASQPGLRARTDDADKANPTYVIPRLSDCILGGTYEPHSDDLAARDVESTAIVARCRALEPQLREAQVLQVRVGLRPGRPAVRLEVEARPGGKRIVHNYGHGGAGVTVSWGCAAEVVRYLAPFGMAVAR